MGAGPVVGAAGVDQPAGGEHQPVDAAMVEAVVRGLRPAAERLGSVVMAANQSRVVDVEDLLARMRVHTLRESDGEAAPRLPALVPPSQLAPLVSLMQEDEQRR